MSYEDENYALFRANYKLQEQIKENDDELLSQKLEIERLRKRLHQVEDQNIQLKIQLRQKERNIERLNDMLHLKSRPPHLSPYAAPDLQLEPQKIPPTNKVHGSLGLREKSSRNPYVTLLCNYWIDNVV